MNTELRFKQNGEQKVYLTSDCHIFHNPKWEVPIWKMRGFNSLEESNRYIIDSINNTVGGNDILINLGDITLNCSEIQFESLLSQIKCQNIYLLFGNHNSPCWGVYQREVKQYIQSIYGDTHYNHLEEIEIYPLRYRNIIFVGNYLEFVVDGIKCVASHYPIHSFNGQTKGGLHFFGHIHSDVTTPKLNGRKMDVGFDYYKRPISFNEAKDVLLKIPIQHEGHH